MDNMITNNFSFFFAFLYFFLFIMRKLEFFNKKNEASLNAKVQGYTFFMPHLKITFNYAWQRFCLNGVVYLQFEK